MDDKIKIIATGLLIVVALVLGFTVLTQKPSDETPVDKGVFLESLAASQNVYIIMDLQSVFNETVKNNVMQCGVDFAGSEGLVNKNITTFALDAGNCTRMEGQTSIASCLDESKAGVTIVVQNLMNTTYYKNKVVVRVGPVYTKGTCNIKIAEQ